MQVLAKIGCHRCCELVGKLSVKAKTKVIWLRGSNCCGFIGLGDVVEAVIHAFGLHKVWAWVNHEKPDWVCPACMRRKAMLNKLWYFGDKSTKSLWLALVNDKYLPANAEYPFLVYNAKDGSIAFSEIHDEYISNPEHLSETLENDNV